MMVEQNSSENKPQKRYSSILERLD